MTKENITEMLQNVLSSQTAAEDISRALVALFNDHLAEKCEHFNKGLTEDAELFMNYCCIHSERDGHCCIALCPLSATE